MTFVGLMLMAVSMAFAEYAGEYPRKRWWFRGGALLCLTIGARLAL